MPLRPQAERFVERWAHPLILAGALALWWLLGRGELAFWTSMAAVLLLLQVLERWVPAMPDWRIGAAATARLIGVYLIGLWVSGLIVDGYRELLPPALHVVRDRIGAALWPQSWPWLAQALLLFFAADLIYYWIHRAIHRSAWLWRITGHGFHHGFHNLQSLNVGSNHPFELVFVALPLALLAGLTDAPAEAVRMAGVLLLTNTTLAHANLRMDTPVLRFFLTDSGAHRRHHSAVFEDSNTNYACNAIVWDRLFGTYSRGPVAQTGIGPRQPPIWRLYLLPFREPPDVDTVATRSNAPE
ncbi:sterol desaturase family protein [Pseudomonas sp. CGJS7]|uniref:sterol desaturase family protein n=1 Tax=Pseudomonas sp. CGJS7 TaxID=3109348 RepID=UPI00300A3F2B